MAYELDPQQIDGIVRALLSARRDLPSKQATTILRRIGRAGWMDDWLLDDVLHATDHRLLALFDGFDVSVLADAAGLSSQSVTRRPRARGSGAVMTQARPAANAASLLILLEDLGFSVDPRPLTELVLSTIPRGGLITAAQLDVLWYARRRLARVTTLRAPPPVRVHEIEERRLETGHRLEIHRDVDGNAVALTVKGPKYRRRPEPVRTTCPDCGHVWYRGDTDSSAAHRREHKERMPFLDPKPHPQMIVALKEADHERVSWASPAWRHEEMDERARIFRREMHYSFVGWGVRQERDRHAQGYLFADPDGAIVGACAFRWREYRDAEPGWALQWIWVCPTARRTGVVTARWADFRARFGDFVIERPISEAMQAFVRSVGDGHMLEPRRNPRSSDAASAARD